MFNVVGKPIKKHDGLGHVTGKTQYVVDLKMPGMLVGKVLRSPYHRARIHSIDVSEAKKVSGVYAVVTKDDIPNNVCGMVPDHHILAEEITRYKGQNVAAVAAINADVALYALSKIKLEIEELPYVIDPVEAAKEGAVQVRPEGNFYLFDGKNPVRKLRRGNIEEGFKQADYIVEGSYITHGQEHAPIEPSCSLAYVDGTGKLIIHTKSQGMYFAQGEIANALQIPLNKLQLIGGTIGGGFGALNSVSTDHIAGLLALKSGKPVRYELTREEEMTCTTIRASWVFTFKDGIRKDGIITARQIDVLHDCGGYSELGVYAAEKNTNFIGGANMIKNLEVNTRLVYTNKVPSGSMRGFGVNVGQFAEQTQTDKLARTVGISPYEIRLINAFKEGDPSHAGNELSAVSTIETMQRVAKMAGENLPEKYMCMSSK